MGSAFVPLAIEKGWSWQTATRTAAFLIVLISFLVVGHDVSGVEGRERTAATYCLPIRRCSLGRPQR